MALRREQLSPVDGFDSRIDWQGAMDRWNQRALHWVLGPGFLSCHLTTFGLSFLALLTWNLIADPADLHMIEPFRYWGVIVVFHIILLGGGMIGWKLLHMGETESRRFTIPAYQLPQLRANSTARTPHWQNAWTRSTAAAGRANATARRWAGAPTRETEPPQPAPPPARDAQTGWPEVPAIFRTAAVESDITEVPPVDVGAATWPGSAPLSTTLANGDTSNPADEVVSVDHRGADHADDDPAKSWIDGFVESRSKDKDQRWSWVEAAAAAWLNKREVEGKTEKALTAGETQIESADAAPPPADADQSQTASD
jgi:hypothetical protein